MINLPLLASIAVFVLSCVGVYYVLNNADGWIDPYEAIALTFLCCLAGGTLTLATYYALI